VGDVALPDDPVPPAPDELGPVPPELVDPDGVVLEAPAGIAAPPEGRNPAQQEVVDLLGARRADRHEFDPRLRDWLREEMEEAIRPILVDLPEGETIFLNKHRLGNVHRCEGLYLADEEREFSWTPQNARGTVSHKAMELSVHWRGDPVPGVLVDEAMARLIEQSSSIGEYLQGLREAERADLRSNAVEHTTMFLECFPVLEAHWRPVTESRLRVDLLDERVVLSGKVDLTLGRADGVRAGKVLIDLKTGAFSPVHREDLRFYALLEAIRIGTPPRLVASYYLDGGRIHQEIVTEDLLAGAARRVVDGVRQIIALEHVGQAPTLKPGAPCRWCPVRTTCVEGIRFLERQDQEDGVEDSW
jgi:hypothetical protein